MANREDLLKSVARYHAFFKLTPFTMDTERCELRRTCTGTLYSVVILIASLATAARVIYWLQALTARHMYNINFLWLFGNGVTRYATMITALAGDLLQNTHKYQRILTLLSYRDSGILGPLSTSAATSKIFIAVMYMVSLALLVAGTATFPSIYWNWTFGFNFITHNIATTTAYKYVGLVLLVRSELRQLNECLRATAPAMRQRQTLRSRYRSLTRVYSQLCELSQEVLSAHETFLVLFMLHVLSSVSFIIANLIASFQDNLLMNDIFNLVRYTSHGFMVIAASHELSREAMQTAPILCQVQLCSSLSSTEVVEMRRFCSLARHVNPSHRLCGIVPLDLRLLLTFISLITTFTVILITFGVVV